MEVLKLFFTLLNRIKNMAFQFTDANFKESALDYKGVTVVDFGAEWCGPCRIIAPIIEELAAEYGETARIGKMDVDDNPEISTKYGVRSIPTLLFLRDGEIIDKHVGLMTKQGLKTKLDAAMATVSF
jgi:thioredoxin 1